MLKFIGIVLIVIGALMCLSILLFFPGLTTLGTGALLLCVSKYLKARVYQENYDEPRRVHGANEYTQPLPPVSDTGHGRVTNSMFGR